MRTQDILRTGIDRNFLRKCIDQKIIDPHQVDGKDIINSDYRPYEYSQEDLEAVWNAYLYRKIGLSYKQIQQLINGEEIKIRKSTIELINEYEEQIEELKLIIVFLKYVKAAGFVPQPPNSLIGSTTFKEYIADFIELLDPDKKLQNLLIPLDYMINTPPDTWEDEKIEEMKSAVHLETTEDEQTKMGIIYYELLNLHNSNVPINDFLVQKKINAIYAYQKIIDKNENLTIQVFVSNYISMLSLESDFQALYVNLFGKSFLDYFIKALAYFLVTETSEK